VSSAPPPDVHRLYKISLSRDAGSGRPHLQVREAPAEGKSLIEGAVFVLDKGTAVWQFNTKASVGQEKFRAAEFAHSLLSEREGHKEEVPHVYDEGAGASKFLAELGLEAMPDRTAHAITASTPPTLYKMTDSSGSITFEPVNPLARSSLISDDAFLLDHSGSAAHPAIYVWIGKSSSLTEQRLALQYAQNFAHKKQAEGGNFKVAISLVKVKEGNEPNSFIHAFDE